MTETCFPEAPVTVPELLRDIALQYGDLPAVCDKEKCYTYRELVSRIAGRGTYLSSLCLKPGDTVAVMDVNSTDAMEWLPAIPAFGYRVLMLSPSLEESSLSAILRKADVRLILAPERYAGKVEKYGIPVADIRGISDKPSPFYPAKPDEPAAVFMTGGIDGIPKGAELTHRALMTAARHCTHDTCHRRYIAMLPLFHIFGAVSGYLSCLYTGSLIRACEGLNEALRLMRSFQPTSLVLTPGIAAALMDLADQFGPGLIGPLEEITCGAAPLPVTLKRRFMDRGVRVMCGYGMTETAGPVSLTTDCAQDPDCDGYLLPEFKAKTVNGELWLKGSSVMTGYCGDPELTENAFSDGWFRTGDLVRLESTGDRMKLTVLGRLKNMILLPDGENVYPEELERLFREHPEVKDCLVREIECAGEPVIGIEIVPAAPGKENDSFFRQLADEINSGLPACKHIRKIIIRDTGLPLSPAMKTVRKGTQPETGKLL